MSQYLVARLLDGSVFKMEKSKLVVALGTDEATRGDLDVSVATKHVQRLTDEQLLRMADRLEWQDLKDYAVKIKQPNANPQKLKFAWRGAVKCFMNATELDAARAHY